MTMITAAVCAPRGPSRSGITIDSLLKQSLDAALYDILVVDCAAESPGEQPLPSSLSDARNVTIIGAPGASIVEARQIALELASAPYLALLSPDAVAGRRWLETIRAGFYDTGTDCAMIGGKVDPLWGEDRPLWLPDALLPLLGIVDLGAQRRRLTPTDHLSSVNVALRVAPLKACGGFEQDPLYGDDDLGMLPMTGCRIVDAYTRDGLEIIWDPEAEVRLRLTSATASQDTIRGRMAQKAVKDFIRNPDRAAGHAAAAWDRVHGYFDSVSPRLRNPNGLFEDMTEPDQVLAQANLVYDTMMTLLLGVGAQQIASEATEESERIEAPRAEPVAAME